MLNNISNKRIGSVVCLLLTLVISLLLGQYYVDDLVEGLTVESMNDTKSKASAPAPAPATSSDLEGFQTPLPNEPIDARNVIETLPKIQPPLPEKYSSIGVFGHLFGMSNPNELFEMPRI